MSSRSRLAIALLSTTIACYVAFGTLFGRVVGDSAYGQLALFGEVLHLVTSSYVEPINAERAMRNAELGLTEALDGDSAYLDANEFREYQQPSRRADADVGLALTRRFGFLLVVAAQPGSPAARAGLKTGDVLKTIDGRHTRSIAVPTGERLLRGAPGSVVELAVMRRSNDPLKITIVREQLEPARPTLTRRNDGAAVLKLADLSEGAAEAVRDQLEELRRDGIERLVLDLRGAAFGRPAEAVKIAELFLRGGVVTRLVQRHEAEKTFNAEARRSAWPHALAVLIDTGTSGPAEIVAAALADAKRGPLVGSRTIGRAGIQRAFALHEGGVVLTVGKYLTPGGKPIHEQGLEPTVAVARRDDSESGEEEGDAADPALEKALELLATPERKAADVGDRGDAVLPFRLGARARASQAVPA